MMNSDGNERLKNDDKVTVPIDVYCSLVKCALNNTTQESTNTNNNKEKSNDNDLNINKTIQTLLKMTNKIENQNSNDKISIPVPPNLLKGQLKGDLKNSIDQVKQDILNQYSLYYNLEEYDIPTRLNILSQHNTPNNKVEVSNEVEGYNPSTGIIDMLNTLKSKFEYTCEKITLLENELDSKVNNPDLREWQYSRASKELRGQRDMEGMEEMSEHIRNLYGTLLHQVKMNQMKIDALQKKLLAYTAHNRILSQRQPHDKRLAF